jgi:hypothetical protein
MCQHCLGLNLSRLTGCILLGAVSYTALAAPEEIQVYMDEMKTPGEIGLDIHQNYVFSGSDVSEYPGAQTPRHVFRLTPEFSYGLTPNLELGAYVLTSRDTNGNSTVDGQKLRLKYTAPKLSNQAYFAGANLEIGRVDYRLNENPWNGELKGIYGCRTDRWTYAINVNLDFKVSGPVTSPSTLNLASKLSYKTSHGYQIGVESYNDLGEVRSLGRLSEQSQTLYGVIDTKVHGWDINFGLGRGFTSASDRWLMKAVLGVPFGQ